MSNAGAVLKHDQPIIIRKIEGYKSIAFMIIPNWKIELRYICNLIGPVAQLDRASAF